MLYPIGTVFEFDYVKIYAQVEDLEKPNANHWETYYGPADAGRQSVVVGGAAKSGVVNTNRKSMSVSSSSTATNSLYNTPYYDYRREQSKVSSV